LIRVEPYTKLCAFHRVIGATRYKRVVSRNPPKLIPHTTRIEENSAKQNRRVVIVGNNDEYVFDTRKEANWGKHQPNKKITEPREEIYFSARFDRLINDKRKRKSQKNVYKGGCFLFLDVVHLVLAFFHLDRVDPPYVVRLCTISYGGCIISQLVIRDYFDTNHDKITNNSNIIVILGQSTPT